MRDRPADVDESGRDITTITGRLTYRQRIALPLGCTATVSLLDVSRADAPAIVIARQTIELVDRQVPIRIELGVRSDRMDARHRYSMRATIDGPNGDLEWTSDTANPIDTGSNAIDLGDIVLVQASPRRVGNGRDSER